jgi:hypothetical protein
MEKRNEHEKCNSGRGLPADPELERLHQLRHLLLAAEVGTLLHDVGKLSSTFLRAKSSDCREQDRHGEALQLFAAEIPAALQAFFSTPLEVFGPAGELLPRFLRGIRLEHFISAHHVNKHCDHLPVELLPFSHFLQACDRFSSAEDKANPSDQAKQGYQATYRSTPFGLERRVSPEQLDRLRAALWLRLTTLLNPGRIVQARRALVPLLRRFFSPALAETRRGSNDLDLFHHSWSVASYLKAGLTGVLWGAPLPQDMEEVQRQILVVKTAFPWPVRSVAELRRFLEEAYPVGNFFFQETDELWFLVASLPVSLRSALEERMRLRWPGVSCRWEPFPTGQEVISFRHDPVLEVPPGCTGLLLGIRAFIGDDGFDTLLAKRLEHIEPGLDFMALVERTRQVLALTELAEANRLRAIITSRQRHLANLRQARKLGKLSLAKAAEYRRKMAELEELRKSLRRLEQRDWSALLPPGESLKEARERLMAFIDQVFSWMHPPDPFQVSRLWGNRRLPAEWVALRWVLRKGPSVSRLMAMMEEGQSWLRGVSRLLGKPLLLTPTWALFPVGGDALHAAATCAYNKRFAKMTGRLPWAVLPPGRWREAEVFRVRWRKVRALQGFDHSLEILFSDGDRWRFPRDLGGGEEDGYYLFGWARRPQGTATPSAGLAMDGKTLLPLQALQPGDRLHALEAGDPFSKGERRRIYLTQQDQSV